jgi:hypothetical protein
MAFEHEEHPNGHAEWPRERPPFADTTGCAHGFSINAAPPSKRGRPATRSRTPGRRDRCSIAHIVSSQGSRDSGREEKREGFAAIVRREAAGAGGGGATPCETRCAPHTVCTHGPLGHPLVFELRGAGQDFGGIVAAGGVLVGIARVAQAIGGATGTSVVRSDAGADFSVEVVNAPAQN